MVPCTRRRLLHGATGLLAALAGCADATSDADTASGPEPVENAETDPEHHVLRTPREKAAAWLQSETTRETTTNRDGEVTHRPVTGVIATRERAARLAFADVDGAERAQAFVAETDFDRETLLVDPQGVPECYELSLCHVTWSETQYHTYYARFYRDVDVACSTDERDRVTVFIRIPDALDPDRVTGSGSGVASGTCRGWERRLERRLERQSTGTATNATDGGGTETTPTEGR